MMGLHTCCDSLECRPDIPCLGDSHLDWISEVELMCLF